MCGPRPENINKWCLFQEWSKKCFNVIKSLIASLCQLGQLSGGKETGPWSWPLTQLLPTPQLSLLAPQGQAPGVGQEGWTGRKKEGGGRWFGVFFLFFAMILKCKNHPGQCGAVGWNIVP